MFPASTRTLNVGIFSASGYGRSLKPSLMITPFKIYRFIWFNMTLTVNVTGELEEEENIPVSNVSQLVSTRSSSCNMQ